MRDARAIGPRNAIDQFEKRYTVPRAATRTALGIARLPYAGVIVLLICAGDLFGFMVVGAKLAIAGSSPPVPLVIDVVAAGCAVASFGTFFSMPWRLLAFPIAAFSAVVSLMPGFFLFNAGTGLVELVSIGPSAPAALLTSIVTNGATAFLIVMAMTFGLILPRMLFERVLPAPA